MPERMHRFGPELRRRRLAAGLTLDGLAALVHYSKSHLSKVETGRQRPSPELARLCDAALGAEGALAGIVPPRTAPAAPATAGQDKEVWLLRMDRNGSSWFEAVDRRELGAAVVGEAIALGMRGTQATGDVRGANLVEAAGAMFTQFRRLGQTSGPEVVLPALIAQTYSLEQLASRCGPRTRRRLLVLASRYAEYTGWMAQEAGNDAAALWWTDRAVELAAAGGDGALAAYALVRRALVSMLDGDIPQAVALADRALRSGASPRVQGLAAQQQAQSHALLGDYNACMRDLDKARQLLARESSDPDTPVIGTSHVPDVVTMYTGWCLHHLGRPQRAAEVFDQEIEDIPAHALRTRSRYGVRRALAHAAAGEIDHACGLIGPLLGQVDLVQSATILTDLHRLARVLRRHPRNPSVRGISALLTAALGSAPA